MEFVSTLTTISPQTADTSSIPDLPHSEIKQAQGGTAARHDEIIDLTINLTPEPMTGRKSSPAFSSAGNSSMLSMIPEDELVIISAAEFAQLEYTRHQWDTIRADLDLAYLEIESLRAAADTERRIRDHLEAQNRHLVMENRRLQTDNQLLQAVSRNTEIEHGDGETYSDHECTRHGDENNGNMEQNSDLEILLGINDDQTGLRYNTFDFDTLAQVARYSYEFHPIEDREYRPTQYLQYQNTHDVTKSNFVDLTVES